MLAPGFFRGIESNSERNFWIGPPSLLLRGVRHFHVVIVTKHLSKLSFAQKGEGWFGQNIFIQLFKENMNEKPNFL